MSCGVDYDFSVKCIIIGDSGCGKSSLLYRYTDKDWNPHYIATIGVDFKVVPFTKGDRTVKLQLWDTAGQERFRTITHSYYRGAHGIMLVFDLTNADSVDNITTWLNDIKKFGVDGSPMLLVGNKSDCVAHRAVPSEVGQSLASRLGCKYIETSAKENTNVDSAFQELVDMCLKRWEVVKGRKATLTMPQQETVSLEPASSSRGGCC